MSAYLMVHSKMRSRDEAERIGEAIVNARLAAAAQVSGPVDSSYWWHGRVEKASEFGLVAITAKDRVDDVVKFVKASHSYVVPEIIVIPIVGGSEEYLTWISAETRESGEPG